MILKRKQNKTSVFDLTYYFQTRKGSNGVVRADSITEAAEKINDAYMGLDDECCGVVCLSLLDDDYGVVEFKRGLNIGN